MKKMFLLFNHILTEAQINDARSSMQIDEFVYPPAEIIELWGNVPQTIANIEYYMKPIKSYLTANINTGDHILIQGDFGATYMMVNISKQLGAIPLYATTTREVIETITGDVVKKESIFKHERFRVYE